MTQAIDRGRKSNMTPNEAAVKLIEVTPVRPKPCVYLSGGIDSSIILHCLRTRYNGPIQTYTAQFGDDRTDKKELKRAQEIAKLYGAAWMAVQVGPIVDRFEELLAHFEHARYNLWPIYLAEQAQRDGCKSAYIGEGGDEVFGYRDRTYEAGWAGHKQWVVPTYQTLNSLCGLETVMPFTLLPHEEMRDLWHPDKATLREAFRDVIPRWILKAPSKPPRFTQYQRTWAKDFPEWPLKSGESVKLNLQKLAQDAWLKARGFVVKEAG